MTVRDHYRALLLDHLYGLLEPNQARELEAYLATPEGADLARDARRCARGLIASAAKTQFPDVTFVPPPARAVSAAAGPAPKPRSAVPMSKSSAPPAGRSRLAPWLIAAAVLAVVGGLGVPAYQQLRDWKAQSQRVQDLTVAFAKAEDDLAGKKAEFIARSKAVKDEHDRAAVALRAAHEEHQKAVEKAREAVRAKQFAVRLEGPARASPARRTSGRSLPSRRTAAATPCRRSSKPSSATPTRQLSSAKRSTSRPPRRRSRCRSRRGATWPPAVNSSSKSSPWTRG